MSDLERKYIERVSLKETPSLDSYLNNLPAVRYLAEGAALEFTSDVVFFVGENGTGKSTLLEAIAVACGFNAEGGTRNFRFSTRATHSELHRLLRISKLHHPRDGFFLRAESFYNVASNIDDMDSEESFAPLVIESYGGVSLHQQSHGESFMALVQNRFGGDGLYLLDEPEAALSPSRLLTLMAEIHALVKRNSQFVIATHSPILLAFPHAQIFQFTEQGIEEVPYYETEHYRLYKQFLNNPEGILRHLLDK